MIIKAIIILMMLEVIIILLIIKAQAVKGQERLASINKRGWPPAPLVRAQHHQHHHQPNKHHG